jgi:hypothetical protein
METVYVIIKHEEILDLSGAIFNKLNGIPRNKESNTTPKHFESPLCFQTEKEAAERIKQEILKDTSCVFSIEKRYVATKDERRKALIP